MSAVRFSIDFFNKTITGTKASFHKASKGCGPEYEELTVKIAAHPDFTLEMKEPKHKTAKAKKTYVGLDFHFMEAYIGTLDNAKAVMTEYEAVKAMAVNCGTKPYPLAKKWFLGKFNTEEAPFDMDKAKEAIGQFRIDRAVSGALSTARRPLNPPHRKERYLLWKSLSLMLCLSPLSLLPDLRRQ